MTGFTHLDDEGSVHMVDVGDKSVTRREAVATATISMTPETRGALFGGGVPKGDALAVARIAAIQGVKKTSDLIPLCHPIAVDSVSVDIAETDEGAVVMVTAGTSGRTGIEMEAMTGASVGALTLYDMIKGLDRSATIGPIALEVKTGGKSGMWNRA